MLQTYIEAQTHLFRTYEKEYRLYGLWQLLSWAASCIFNLKPLANFLAISIEVVQLKAPFCQGSECSFSPRYTITKFPWIKLIPDKSMMIPASNRVGNQHIGIRSKTDCYQRQVAIKDRMLSKINCNQLHRKVRLQDNMFLEALERLLMLRDYGNVIRDSCWDQTVLGRFWASGNLIYLVLECHAYPRRTSMF